MESKDGSTLALIAGIIHILFDIFFLIIIFLFSGGMPFMGAPNTERVALGFFLGFIMLGMGVMFIVSSTWMKDPLRVKRGAITSLILGIVNALALIFWWWSIPGVMAIIAGFMALKASKK